MPTDSYLFVANRISLNLDRKFQRDAQSISWNSLFIHWLSLFAEGSGIDRVANEFLII